jgi:hypothetical protein
MHSSGVLYSLQEGGNGGSASGGASALGDVDGAVTLEWTLAISAPWAIRGVLLKQAGGPTRAVVGSVKAFDTDRGPTIQWETLSEHGTVGFHVRRYDDTSGRFERINRRLLPGLLHSRRGGTYRLHDDGVRVGETHRYDIIETEADGSRLRQGPYEVTVADQSADLEKTTNNSPDEDGYQRQARKESKTSRKRRNAKQTAHVPPELSGCHLGGSRQRGPVLLRAGHRQPARKRKHLLVECWPGPGDANPQCTKTSRCEWAVFHCDHSRRGQSLFVDTATPRGLFASDNLYADVKGNDSMPEMAIGRLPVIDAIELNQVTAKLIAYEAGSGDWTRAVTFAADPRDSDGGSGYLLDIFNLIGDPATMMH